MMVTLMPSADTRSYRDQVAPNTAVETSESTLRRIRSEYFEMPGLCLTAVQAKRLWGLNHQECEILLNQLVEGRFLRRTQHGTFVRA